MDEVTPKTAEEFGFKAINVRKLKYMYICYGEKETRIIKKTSLNEEEIKNVYEFKEYLFKNGFYNTDRYFMSKNDVPYYKNEENIFIMTNGINMAETSFSDYNQVIKAMPVIAEFHKIGKGFCKEECCFLEGDILQTLEKRIKKLKAFRKIARNKKRISDFDIMFMKSFENIYEKAEKALEIIKKTDFKHTYSICHNSLKEETLAAGDKVYITGMDTLSKNSGIIDIADIIERYIRKQEGEIMSIESFINEYSCVHNIDSDGIAVLYALLLFPCGYIKICEELYSKNRNWVPGEVIQKFGSIIEVQNKNEKYISTIAVK